jgi:FkbM family methyltransferase
MKSQTKSVVKDLLPPIVWRTLRNYYHRGNPEPEKDQFYASLVPPSGLCFDIGANMGNRLASFRRLGFRVIALEPQSKCYSILQSSFGRDPLVTILRKAVGRTHGQATIMISDAHWLSTLSNDFIETTTNSGRFKGQTWNKTEAVEVVTLDELIAQYGVPDFVKVDVEGFENEVICGLSRPLRLISLEFTPELTANMLECIEHISKLGPVSFNLSWVESFRMSQTHWLNKDQIISLLNTFREETYLFGDLYIRSEPSDLRLKNGPAAFHF